MLSLPWVITLKSTLCALLPDSFSAGFREKDTWGLPHGQISPHSPLPCHQNHAHLWRNWNSLPKLSSLGTRAQQVARGGRKSTSSKTWLGRRYLSSKVILETKGYWQSRRKSERIFIHFLTPPPPPPFFPTSHELEWLHLKFRTKYQGTAELPSRCCGISEPWTGQRSTRILIPSSGHSSCLQCAIRVSPFSLRKRVGNGLVFALLL